VADVRALGMSEGQVRRRLASGALERPQPDVYLVPMWRDRFSALAALLARCPLAVASHRSAAWLWGLLDGDEAPLEVTVPQSTRLRWAGVHRSNDLPATDVTDIEGLATTTITRTLVDVGVVCPYEVVAAAVERALIQRLTTVAEMQALVGPTTGRGRQGAAVLRAVLADRPDRPTPGEELVAAVERAGFGPPRVEFAGDGSIVLHISGAFGISGAFRRSGQPNAPAGRLSVHDGDGADAG